MSTYRKAPVDGFLNRGWRVVRRWMLDRYEQIEPCWFRDKPVFSPISLGHGRPSSVIMILDWGGNEHCLWTRIAEIPSKFKLDTPVPALPSNHAVHQPQFPSRLIHLAHCLCFPFSQWPALLFFKSRANPPDVSSHRILGAVLSSLERIVLPWHQRILE